MKLFLRIAVLSVLLATVAAIAPRQSVAQDVLTLRTQSGGDCCWFFDLKNANTQNKSINKISFTATSLGTMFSDLASFKPDGSLWNDPTLSNNGTTITYTSGQTVLAPGATQTRFGLCFDTDTIRDVPRSVTWTTYNNNEVLSTGTLSLTCTPFQYFGKLDTVRVTTKTVGSDPCFSFTVDNRNEANSPLHSFAIQLGSPTYGTPRPSGVMAPAGWKIDSINSQNVYFSAINSSSDILSGDKLGGFDVCLRAPATISSYGFVWQLREGGGILIDRDTLKNVAATSTGSSNSADTVKSFNVSGCLYEATLSNFHVANVNPISRITSFKLSTSSPGVKFTGGPQAPFNWAAALGAGGTSLTYASGGSADNLQSGNTGTFRYSVDNPSGGAFTIHWQSFNGTTETGSGDIQGQCQVVVAADEAVITPTDNCCYKITISNKHQPASNIASIGLQIAAGGGTFTGNPASSSSWTVNSTGNGLLFRAPVGGELATNATEDLSFCVAPTQQGVPTDITWTTIGAAADVIGTGKVSFSCSTVNTTCDTVTDAVANQDECRHTFTITNRRSNDIRSFVIRAKNGWMIDEATAPVPLTVAIDPTKTFATFTGTISKDVAQSNINVRFKGENTASNFDVDVVTIGEDQRQCTQTFSMTCTPTVVNAVGDQPNVKFAMSVSPNPTRSSTTQLSYTMPYTGHASVVVIDMLGRTVSTLVDAKVEPGTHVATIDASKLTPGTYYIRLDAGANQRMTRKFVVK